MLNDLVTFEDGNRKMTTGSHDDTPMEAQGKPLGAQHQLLRFLKSILQRKDRLKKHPSHSLSISYLFPVKEASIQRDVSTISECEDNLRIVSRTDIVRSISGRTFIITGILIGRITPRDT